MPLSLTVGMGNAHPAVPAARNLGSYHGTGEIVPFVNRTFEWGVVILTFLSVLSILPPHCARLTSFFHPKLRKINAVPHSQLPLPCGAQEAFPWPICFLGLRRGGLCQRSFAPPVNDSSSKVNIAHVEGRNGQTDRPGGRMEERHIVACSGDSL